MGQGIFHPAALGGAESLYINGTIRMILGDDAAPKKMVIKGKAFAEGKVGSVTIETGDRITLQIP